MCAWTDDYIITSGYSKSSFILLSPKSEGLRGSISAVGSVRDARVVFRLYLPFLFETFLCPLNIYWATHRVDRNRIYVFACNLRYFYPMLIRTGIFRRILAKLHKIEFRNGPSSESPGITCEQMGVRTEAC